MSNSPNRDTLASGSDLNRSEPSAGDSVRSLDVVGPESVGDLVITPEEPPVGVSGRLPPPHVLAAYEDVGKGSAARILRQVEATGEHRRGLESAVVASSLRLRKREQWFAFVATMTALVGGIGWTAIGEPIFGVSITIIALGLWAGTFVWTMSRDGRATAGGSAADRTRLPSEVDRSDKEPIPLLKPDGGGSG